MAMPPLKLANVCIIGVILSILVAAQNFVVWNHQEHGGSFRTSLHSWGSKEGNRVCSDAVDSTKSFCDCLPRLWPTEHHPQASLAHSLWLQHKEQLRQATYESISEDCWNDPTAMRSFNDTAFDDLFDRLYAALTPYRLHKSIKTEASPLVMEKQQILSRRADPQQHPVVKIAVFGGSVTEGVESSKNRLGLPYQERRWVSCSWPQKLQRLLDRILGANVVLVKNYAVSSTTSDMAYSLLKFNLWPDPEHRPAEFDIVISAFSSNDGRALSEERGLMHTSMQQFVRACQDLRPCSDLPLVIQLEDNMLDTFMGNNVMDGLLFSREMVETANWAGIMSLSYADAIRDFVYASDPSDTTLTEYNHCHPGLSFHTGVAWVVAWNLLNGMLSACDAPYMPEYNHPEPRVGPSLPLLDEHLRSVAIASVWHQSKTDTTARCQAMHDDKEASCPYSWVASRLHARTKEQVEATVRTVATHVDGWSGYGYQVRKPRRTWLGEGLFATFTIQLNNLTVPINHLMIMVSSWRACVYMSFVIWLGM